MYYLKVAHVCACLSGRLTYVRSNVQPSTILYAATHRTLLAFKPAGQFMERALPCVTRHRADRVDDRSLSTSGKFLISCSTAGRPERVSFTKLSIPARRERLPRPVPPSYNWKLRDTERFPNSWDVWKLHVLYLARSLFSVCRGLVQAERERERERERETQRERHKRL